MDPGMSLWHVILACHSGMSQMMLAIFSTQGRINRAFFDQRAEKDTSWKTRGWVPRHALS